MGADGKILGIVHAYPSQFVVDSLAKEEWKLVFLCPKELEGNTLFEHTSIVETIFCNFSDDSELMEQALKSHDKQNWSAVLPIYEGAVEVSSKIANALNLPTNAITATTASRNKYKTYDLLKESNIPCPDSTFLHSIDDLEKSVKKIGFPAIVKLPSSMNSQGVIRVDDYQSCRFAAEKLFSILEDEQEDFYVDRNIYVNQKSSEGIILQTYCDGIEVGVDLIYRNNDWAVLGIFEKAPSTGPYFAEQYSVFPTSLSKDVEEQVCLLALNSIVALGASIGSAHVEIRFNQDRPFVIEVGLRPGGGFTSVAIERTSGVNVYRALADVLVNDELCTDVELDRNQSVLYGGILNPSEGTLVATNGIERVTQLSEVVEFYQLFDIGDYMNVMPKAAQPHFAYYLLQAKSRGEALALHQNIQETIKLTINPPEENQNEFMMLGQKILSEISQHHSNGAGRAIFRADKDIYEMLHSSPLLPEIGLPKDSVVNKASEMLKKGYCNVSHPGFFGYISPKPDLFSVLGDLMASGHNQTSGAWRAGPFATAVESQVICWLSDLIGYPSRKAFIPNGIITNGGALANATALKLAKEKKIGLETQKSGLYSQPELSFYGSMETHFSIPRSLDFLGLGKDNLVLIPTTSSGQINLSELEKAIMLDAQNGRIPCCVIAQAGTTSTGQVDDLMSIREVTTKHNMWMHVDGASGAVFAEVPDTAGLFQGISLADSITIDPCKWLFQSFGIGCLLVKDPQGLLAGFSTESHYWDQQEEPDFYQMGLTGTRQWRSLGLWFSLLSKGRCGVTKELCHIRNCARYITKRLQTLQYIEVIEYCELAVFAFRIKADNSSDQESINKKLQQHLLAKGFYLTDLRIANIMYLRGSVSNVDTSLETMDDLYKSLMEFKSTTFTITTEMNQ